MKKVSIKMNPEKAVKQFEIGELESVKSFGDGLINSSFLAINSEGKRYILQRINTELFTDVDGLMNNIQLVTDFLKKKIMERGGDPERETLTVIHTKDDKPYYLDDDHNAWRVYPFIENTVVYNQAQSPEQFYLTGLSFGKFQNELNEFDATQLVEVIEKFHDTRHRYQQFEEAVENDLVGRVSEVEDEINFIKERKEDAYYLYDLLDKGELPLRVTHNDTKLSNILLDKDTLEGIAVIDLDTIMPGILLFDFGDSIRSGANTTVEDDPNLDNVNFDMELFEAYTKGFLEGAKEIMTEKELELLPWGARIITLEQAMRFLTDYLNGDTYYATTHETHNIERTRNQIKMVSEMERLWPEITNLVKEIAA